MRKTKPILIPSQQDSQSSAAEESSCLVLFDDQERQSSSVLTTADPPQNNQRVTDIDLVSDEHLIEAQISGPTLDELPPALIDTMDTTLNDFDSFNHIRFDNERVQRQPTSAHSIIAMDHQPMTAIPIEMNNHPEGPPAFNEDLTLNFIADEIIENSPRRTMPRQLGRRSELHPRIVAINTESHTITISHRPSSAPARVVSADSPGGNNRNNNRYQESVSSMASSRNPSPVSLISSSGSSSAASASQDTANER